MLRPARRSSVAPADGWRDPRGDEQQIRQHPAVRPKTPAAPSGVVEDGCVNDTVVDGGGTAPKLRGRGPCQRHWRARWGASFWSSAQKTAAAPSGGSREASRAPRSDGELHLEDGGGAERRISGGFPEPKAATQGVG
ncbi:hypothetical protein OsI_03966 [Oryza sativa Indica Group]|uniref:Uncharacterized protein n=1 Tax=Oryza sativa subsp. indica TaxID=39946 RepID=A2WVP2_ORYSI|nr:hypothetical protein OsI_03966 [Oryza sativa Indica Group]